MYRVFLSSTAADLDEWRTAVHRTLDQMNGVEVVWMKDWVAHDATSLAVCEEKVRGSDVFVGLVGHCFGSAPDARPDRSYTMLEFDWATEAGLPRLMHVAPGSFTIPADLIEPEDRHTLQRTFRDEIAGWHTGQRESWANPDRLAADVAEAVRQQIVRLQAARQQGFTREKHEVSLLDRLNDLAIAIATAPPDKAATMRAERAEIEAKLRDVETSFRSAQARIAELEALLARERNHLGAERLARAEAALTSGDFDAADALLAEIETDEEPAVQRAARAAFGRGRIAEEQVRWLDAAEHYAKAARLAQSHEAFYKAREFHGRAGDYPRAYLLGEQLVVAARAEFGDGTPEHAEALAEHAQTLQFLGRHAEAEPLLLQAIDISKATVGEAHPDFATYLNNLAGLLRDMDRHAEAEPLYRKAIEIGEVTIGEMHPDFATYLNNLAGLLRDMGRHAEAAPLYQRALEVAKVAMGKAHPHYGQILVSYGRLLGETGSVEQAREMIAEGWTIWRAALGDNSPETRIPAGIYARLLREHFPDDPALADLEATFGPDIGRT